VARRRAHNILADRHKINARRDGQAIAIIAREPDAGAADFCGETARIISAVPARQRPEEKVLAKGDCRRESEYQPRLRPGGFRSKRPAIFSELRESPQIRNYPGLQLLLPCFGGGILEA